MDKTQQSPEEAPAAVVGSGSNESLSAAALARRRALFKGLGKGGAVLAASVPIQTLAGQRVLTNGGMHQCSVSGMQSGVHSADPSAIFCEGYDCDHWGTKKPGKNEPLNWPANCNYQAQCENVFPRCGFPANCTLFEAICPTSGKTASSDKRHWICSWLNANSGVGNYPHKPQEVVAFCSPSHPQHADALAFYQYINKRK